jgi:MYXO-CTERM domain-containing protein
MKLTAFAAVVVAGICPVAAAAVIVANTAGNAKIGTDLNSRPLLTETTTTPGADLIGKPTLIQSEWFMGTTSNAQWSWVRPQTTPAMRLPSTLVNAPAPGAAALIGLAGLIVARRRSNA